MAQSAVSTWTRSRDGVRAAVKEGLAGVVGSVVLIVNIVSFSALMFPGALAAGASTAGWAMLVGSSIVGLWVAWKTTLPPLATGVDSATAAVLVLVAASAGNAVLSAGGTPAQAIQSTMLLFSLASALSGALLAGLGFARGGAYLRFVPFFVVAGFLGATGWLLVAGGIRMTTGHGWSDLLSAGTGPQLLRLLCALVVCLLLLALRRWVRWPLALPAALVVMTLAGTALLRRLGLADPVHGWYLPSLGTLTPWLPFHAAAAEPMSLNMALRFVPELVAVAIVALVSLVTKTSSMEVARQTAGDLDVEMRAHGVATLVAVPLGGLAGNLQPGVSRALDNAGGTRGAGAACAGVLIAVALLNLDLLALLPLPIAAGLVMQLGWGILVEAFGRSLGQRDWPNLLLAAVIAVACVRFGYVAGVIGGVVGACLLFAVSYARVGVVRQHLSRTRFAGNVERSADAAKYLADNGEAIQVYWLSGYIFFGSSEGVFERVRHDVGRLPAGRVGHVILDFGLVPAADASATVSLAKLRNFCRGQGVRLVFSSLPPRLHHVLQRDGFFAGPDAQAPFPDVTSALAWAEEVLLDRSGLPDPADTSPAAVEAWLQQQLGASAPVADFLAYLERRSFGAGEVVYRQGEPADAIDVVACGRLSVEVSAEGARPLRLRRITTRTVIGEMGFFSHAVRSATVTAEGPAVLWTLTRDRFERLRGERPDLAGAFYEFLLRSLADRIRWNEKLVLAMRP